MNKINIFLTIDPSLIHGADSDFAIKCGGPLIRSTDGIVYQTDNETLGPATYFVTDTERWAVSNVGIFTGSNNPVFKSSVTNQFTGTLNPEIFQTARLSASSLRYYGLGLQNGFYNITLQFAETAILDSTTWKSLGRRVFDIYIQVFMLLKSHNDYRYNQCSPYARLRESSHCLIFIFSVLNFRGLVF